MCRAEYFKTASAGATSTAIVPNSRNSTDSQPTLNLCTTDKKFTEVYLQTACVFISATAKSPRMFVRLILDGGSQVSFIKESIARKLNLPIVGTHRLSVIPFGSAQRTPAQICDRVRIYLKGQYSDIVYAMEAVVVPEICLDVLKAPDIAEPRFKGFELADVPTPFAELESGISLLIGADYYWKFVTAKHEYITDRLSAIHTVFGWTLQGPTPTIYSGSIVTSLHLSSMEVDNLNLMNFWDLNILGIREEKEDEELFTNKFIANNIVKGGMRYEACLPWKDDTSQKLNSYRAGALRRLSSLCKRLSKDPSKLLEYDAVMREFISSGFAEPVMEEDEGDRTFYLPHRPVYREDKTTTKIRIVFDASAHAEGFASLNQCLVTGTNLLPDLFKILVNFRIGRIALVADIEKAFLQILLCEKDRNSHRFFWFSEKLQSAANLPSIRAFRMTRVTFGVNCSPFILGATIRKHLQSEAAQFPETCESLRNFFYMDDFVISTNSEESAKRLYRESVQLMKSASMHLRKWSSNSEVVSSQFGELKDCACIRKVLGINWFVISDEIAVDLEAIWEIMNTLSVGTKRTVLRTISRIFDPIGILAPFIIRLKILFQSAWRLKLNWDDVLPVDLHSIWNSCREDIVLLKDWNIPRCILNNSNPTRVELHIFADASIRAYGAVAYLKSLYGSGENCVRFLCSKNRVAPLKDDGQKELTLPKLELAAALVAARLYSYLRKNLNLSFSAATLWSDSKITLYWIRGSEDKWKPYVANRVQEIIQCTNREDWRHCPGKENPADLLTRGLTSQQLKASEIWTNGPQWLQASAESWPLETESTEAPAVFSALLADSSFEDTEPSSFPIKFESFSSWKRLVHTTAYVIRFMKRLRKLSESSEEFLTADELREAEKFWIKFVQQWFYRFEIDALQRQRTITTSRIFSLRPILDSDGILRVGGRLDFLEEGVSHPVILPKSSHISKLIVKDFHERTFHAGINTTLGKLRERFWITQARQLIKNTIKECIICKKLTGKSFSQPFAPLPIERMMTSRPFATTGVDCAGPLFCKQSDEDCSKKFYIMLFTCATIRAVHLELIPDLSTEGCILSLRRFLARRGVPDLILSDNAKSFKRASSELAQLQGLVSCEEVNGFLSQRGIRWKFIVERAPWWGGFWERLIRSVKVALKAVIGRAILNSDQLQTLLAEVENIINSRPLTYISNSPLDLRPLTPAHILLGTYPQSIQLEVSRNQSSENIRQLWTLRLKSVKQFWIRWRVDYLQQLRSFHHAVKGKVFSSTIKTGDVVIVEDQSVPRILWRLAVVDEIFSGRDGKVRACLVRFSNGSKMRRPVQLLYPLEITEN